MKSSLDLMESAFHPERKKKQTLKELEATKNEN